MKTAQIIMAAFLLGVIFTTGIAATTFAPNATFSCEPIINYQNTYFFNQGYSNSAEIGDCAGTTSRFNNIEIHDEITGGTLPNSTSTTTQTSDGNITHALASTGSPSTFNHYIKIYYFGGATNGSTIVLGAESSINSVTFTGTVTIVQLNSTQYSFTNGTKSITINNTNNITISQDSLSTIKIPVMDVTKLKEFSYSKTGEVTTCTASTTTSGWRLTTEFSTTNGCAITPTFVSKSWGGVFANTDSKSIANSYNATLLSSTATLSPIISFYPITSQSSVTLYNSTTFLVVVKNNSNLYAYDNTTSTWFFCPAYSAPTFVPTYTITCIPASAYQPTGNTIPLFWLTQSCFPSNNNYYWNIKGTDTNSFLNTVVYSNGTVVNSVASGITYTGNHSTVGVVNITISVGTQIVCSYSNSTQILFGVLPQVTQSNTTKIFGQMAIITVLGLSTIAPPAAIGAIIINDTFGFLSVYDMFLAFGFAAAVASIKAYAGDRNLKTLGIFLAMGLSMLTLMVTRAHDTGTAGFENIDASFPEITYLTTSITDLATSVTNPNLATFAVSAASFIINFFIIAIKIPGYVASLLLSMVGLVNPILQTVVREVFFTAISVGMTLWIGLKAWEVISNRFQRV